MTFTTPKTYSPHVAMRLVGFHPHLLTLTSPPKGAAVIFFYVTLPFADSFLLGSRMLCVARTFTPPACAKRARDRPANCFRLQKNMSFILF